MQDGGAILTLFKEVLDYGIDWRSEQVRCVVIVCPLLENLMRADVMSAPLQDVLPCVLLTQIFSKFKLLCVIKIVLQKCPEPVLEWEPFCQFCNWVLYKAFEDWDWES